MNFASRTRHKQPTFYSPERKPHQKTSKDSLPSIKLDSPTLTKTFLLDRINPLFPQKPRKYLRSLSAEKLNQTIFIDQRLFEKKICSLKSQINIELEFLLQELADISKKSGRSDPKIRAFLKVFLNIYVEFLDISIEGFKEEKIRKLFTLIDSSKKSLLHPELSFQEYREFWIIREENFCKIDLNLKATLIEVKALRGVYFKFQFIMTKLSRMLEIKYIIDEEFKDLIKKSSYSFALSKKKIQIESFEMKSSLFAHNLVLAEKEADKRLFDFLVLRSNYWSEIAAEQVVNKNQPSLTCKICLQEFQLAYLKVHSFRCKELAELNQDMLELKKEFSKAEVYAKELMRKIYMENQLERNILKKLKNKANNDDKNMNNLVVSAQIKSNKKRSATCVAESQNQLINNPPSPSIFKRQKTENKSYLGMIMKPINLKEKLNISIRNFMAQPIQSIYLHEIEKSASSNFDKELFEGQTNLRTKMLSKHSRIKNNDSLISLLTRIKSVSAEVPKSLYSPIIELKIDDLKKTLKDKPQIPIHSKVTSECLRFLQEFFHLLVSYNSLGRKILLLAKEEKHSINSPGKRLRRSGRKVSDDEYNSKKRENNKNKRQRREKSPTMPSKYEMEKLGKELLLDSINDKSPKPDSIRSMHVALNTTNSRENSYEFEESPIGYPPGHFRKKDSSFIESQGSNSNNMGSNSLDIEHSSSLNVFSFKTRAFGDSSDDEKSVSVRMSSMSQANNGNDEESEEESPERVNRRCFSDSGGGNSRKEFWNEK